MKRIVPLLPVLAIFVVAVHVAQAAQGLPHYDYWEIFPPLLTPDGLHLTWDALYRRSNEHIVAITRLLYLLNYHVTGGDNYGLSVIACLFSLAIACLLSGVICGVVRPWPESLMLGAAIGVFAFTPMGAHNYLLGMSGVAWLGANLFMVAAACAMYRAQTRGALRFVGGAAVLGLLGGQSYSTGLMILCAIGIQGLLLPKTRRLGIALCVLGVAYVLVVYALQQVPAKHGARTFDPVRLASFVLTMIGGGLTPLQPVAKLWGAIGVAWFALLAWRHGARRSPMAPVTAFCMALASYALMNAGIGAIGRAGIGGDAIAMASRYASLPALFWIALIGLALQPCGATAAPGPYQERRRVGVAAIALGMAMTMVAGASERVSGLIERLAGSDIAALSLYLGVHDDDAIHQYVTPDQKELYALVPRLRQVRHLPFNGTFDQCPAIGSTVVVAEPEPLRGYIDAAERLQDQPWYRVRGWALDPDSASPPLVNRDALGDAVCVALVDPSGVVRGLGVGGVRRPDVAQAFQREHVAFGWQGYVRPLAAPTSGEDRLYAAIRRSSDASVWTRLPHSIVLRP